MIGLTGANGALGSRILREIARIEVTSVMAGTRSGVSEEASSGTMVRSVDFDDAVGMRAAFDGVTDLLLISTGAPVEERIAQHVRAIDAAVEAGVGRVIYTSFIDHRAESPFPFARVHAETEAHLRASAVNHLILRNGQYADRFVEFAEEASATGALRLPIDSEATASFISRDDLARFAAHALVTQPMLGIATPTGSRAVSYGEAADTLGTVLGRDVCIDQCSPEEYLQTLGAQGWPEWEAEAFTRFFEGVANGNTSLVTDDFEEALGVLPEALEHFIRRGLADAPAVTPND